MFRLVLIAVAWASAKASPELLSQDDECAADSECSLYAIQRRVLSRHSASESGSEAQVPKLKDSADIFDDIAGEDDTDEQDDDGDAEDEKSEQKPAPPEPKTAPKEQEAAPIEEDDEETAVFPLPPNPPSPKPMTFESVNPIIVRGNFLYDSVTGERFFAKGVAYNPRNEKYDHSFGPSVEVKGWNDTCVPGKAKTLEYTADTQADDLEKYWSADLEAIANMGANTVRLYNVDPSKDHTKFMKKAESLGLYVIVPLNGKEWGYLPAFPAPDCYTQTIEGYGNVGVNALSFAKQVVKQFSEFPNTLLFTIANEVPQNDKNGWAAFPCVKALTRDVHQYQKNCSNSMRRIPLIYSDVDMGPPDRVEVAEYLTCSLESEDDAVDVYGLNVYSWCDEAYPGDGKKDNFKYSPYYEIHKDFKNFAAPLLFTEFGCNLGNFKTKCPYTGGRTWPEIKHLTGEDMGEVVSGAVAFQWSMDKEEYGLTLSPHFLAGQKELYLLDNYYNLQKVFHKYNASSKWNSDGAPGCKFLPKQTAPMTGSHRPSKCPSKKVFDHIQERHGVSKISDWNSLPPSPNAPLADVNQAECPAKPVSTAVKDNNCCFMKC